MSKSAGELINERENEAISVCVIAGNEEKNIRRCLESVKWADEIVVVDSFSEDRTCAIAREYTDKVFQHEWLGYIGQKKLIKGLASGPWIMFVDADEEVSPGLRDEIKLLLQKGVPETVDGVQFPRMVRYLGRWIKHGDWYPDVKLRLFRKSRSSCGGTEPHDRIYVEGEVLRLRHPLHHYTYSGISDQLASINRFSSISAEGLHREGSRCRLSDLILRPAFRFLRGYLMKSGWRDGMPGLIIAVNIAFGTFVKYAKLWEAGRGFNDKSSSC